MYGNNKAITKFKLDKEINTFNYDFVLNELNKDYNIEGIDRIGFTNKGYEVFIVTDDDVLSDIPHFHYRRKEKGKPCCFHTCIRIDKAEYYKHTGNEDILSIEQIKDLIKFLNSKSSYDKLSNNWEKILISWNSQNENINVDYNLKMPNYINLK